MMKTVFITGISGLLGTNLAHSLLKQEYKVIGLVRNKLSYKGMQHPNLSLVIGDLFSDLSQCLPHVDIVVHAAAATHQGLPKQSDYDNINCKSTIMLYLNALQFKVKRFIFVSTANTIGYGVSSKDKNESRPIRYPFDHSLYAKSKLAAENYLLEKKSTMDLIIINPTFMLGGWNSKHGSNKIVLMGLHKKLVFYPPGGKNFVHVQDVVQAIIKSFVAGKSHEKYLIAGENLSYFAFFDKLRKLTHQETMLVKLPSCLLMILGIVGEILRLCGVQSSLNVNNMRILGINNFYSNEKSIRELGVRYSSIDQAIVDAVDYFTQSSKYSQIQQI